MLFRSLDNRKLIKRNKSKRLSINCSNITTATAKSRLNQENWEEPIENDEEKAEDDSLIENLVDLFESKKPKPRCTASCKRLRLKESSNDETVNQDTKRLVNNKIKSCKIVKFAKIDKDSRLIYPKSPLEVMIKTCAKTR